MEAAARARAENCGASLRAPPSAPELEGLRLALRGDADEGDGFKLGEAICEAIVSARKVFDSLFFYSLSLFSSPHAVDKHGERGGYVLHLYSCAGVLVQMCGTVFCECLTPSRLT